MAIYKNLEKEKDIIKNHNKKDLVNLFENSAFLFKDGGWNYTKNTTFNSASNVVSNSYFVNLNNDFSISYISDKDEDDFSSYLSWNTFMATIGAPYNSENNKYELFANNTKIREAIVIQFNRKNFEEKIDFDNFFLSMSNRTGNTTDTRTGDNFNVNTFFTLAPFYSKNRSYMILRNTPLPVESYELRTSSNSEFLTVNDDDNSIKINWELGNVSEMMGELFPTLGCAVIYLDQVSSAYNDIKQTIVNASDKSLTALNTLMYVGGYGVKSQSEEIVFVRLNNSEFNHTTNPTAFRNLSGIQEYLDKLDNENVTFPTTIGLFNDQNECLATISLSKPEKKSPLTELPLRVKLNI